LIQMNGVLPIIASSWRAPILQTAIALIGAAGAIAGGAFGSWFTWQKERQSVAAAFRLQPRATRTDHRVC